MPSVRIYNVNSHENKEKTLNEKACSNFDCYCTFIQISDAALRNVHVRLKSNPKTVPLNIIMSHPQM